MSFSKMVGLLAGLLLVYAFTLGTAFAAPSSGTVNADRVNIRTEPSTSALVSGHVSKGDRLDISQESAGWYKVSNSNVSGWIYVQYITSGSAVVSDEQGEDMKPEIKTVIGTSVNLRQEPNTSSKIVGKVTKGKKVAILDKENDWYKVLSGEARGWIYGQYLSDTGIQEVKQDAAPTEGKSAVITASRVNIRGEASLTSAVITRANANDKIVVTGESNEWCQVIIGGNRGWVSSQYVKYVSNETAAAETEAKPLNIAVITASDVNIREENSLSSKIIGRAAQGEKGTILQKEGDWYKLSLAKVTGWVYGSYVKEGNVTVSRAGGERTSTADKLIAYAKKFLGVRYVYGADGPGSFDCSGFTCYVFKKFGIELPRVSTEQAKEGTRVSKSSLKPGDLVFFDTDGGSKINHVGIYIGNGKFIQASSARSSREVTISDLDTGFYDRCYITARRVLSE